MITKQQALEFIYELSKLHVIYLDIPCGYAYIDKEEDEYRAWADDHTLEALVTEIIKDNMGNALLMDFNEIPVDIDMLEVGQTYRVIYSNYWDELEEFTSKLSDIDYDKHTNYKLFEFSNGSIKNQGHIEEIYKVNA